MQNEAVKFRIEQGECTSGKTGKLGNMDQEKHDGQKLEENQEA